MNPAGTDRPRATSAFARFFAQESAGGIVLAMATLAALVVSNSPWGAAYVRALAVPGEVTIGDGWLVLAKPLVVWVNDLWMAAFFFLVGLEIKRKFVEGELRSPRQAVWRCGCACSSRACTPRWPV